MHKKIPTVLLAIENSRAYGRGLLRGITTYMNVHQPWFCLSNPDYYHTGIDRTFDIAKIKKDQIDGIIMREMSAPVMKKVQALDIPLIICSHFTFINESPFLMTDCKGIGVKGAEHLLERGYQYFGYCSAGDFVWCKRRENAFVQTVQAKGFDVEVYENTKRQGTLSSEINHLARWLEKLPKPIAIMCSTDDKARDVVDACRASRIRVPEEVAVLGVDNDDLVCEMAHVPISSIALGTREAGYAAAEQLDMLIQQQVYDNKFIIVPPTHVHVRRSTDILAIDDQVVVKALEYIHTNTNIPIGIMEVAKSVGYSERGLYKKFQQSLGRTVAQEIARKRIEKICLLLETTVLTSRAIAEIMNISDEKHLSRYFKKHKQLSPMQWRSQYGHLHNRN